MAKDSHILSTKNNSVFMRILCHANDSHILSTKNNSVFVIFTFEILTNC